MLLCQVTSFISYPHTGVFQCSAGALDIFTPHIALHVVELNLLIQYWSLLCRPFHGYALSLLLSVPTIAKIFLACIWREEGERKQGKKKRKRKHSKSRSIHVVTVWDGSCQRWQFETLDPQKWILGQGQVTAQSNSFFWNVEGDGERSEEKGSDMESDRARQRDGRRRRGEKMRETKWGRELNEANGASEWDK